MAEVLGNLIVDDHEHLWVFTGSRVVLLADLDDPESGYACSDLNGAMAEMVRGGYVE